MVRQFDYYVTTIYYVEIPWNIHDFWRAKRMITFSGRDHLSLTVLTNFIKGFYSFQSNHRKGSFLWKAKLETLVLYGNTGFIHYR